MCLVFQTLEFAFCQDTWNVDGVSVRYHQFPHALDVVSYYVLFGFIHGFDAHFFVDDYSAGAGKVVVEIVWGMGVK